MYKYIYIHVYVHMYELYLEDSILWNSQMYLTLSILETHYCETNFKTTALNYIVIHTHNVLHVKRIYYTIHNVFMVDTIS